MDKNFIENCKALKKHFTKLTEQTDTGTITAQSCCGADYSNDTIKTINKAKKILLMDKLDKLDEIDFQDITHNSLLQYAKEIEELQNKNKTDYHRLCGERDQIKWNDDIFSTPLPCPKNNPEFINSQIKFDTDDNNELINKYNELEISIKKKIDEEKKMNKKDVAVEIKQQSNAIINNKTKLKNEVKIIELKQIPELKIIPQQQKKIETLLEVKKIIADETETNFLLQFDETNLKKVIQKWKSYKRNKDDSKTNFQNNSKIDHFLENIQNYQKQNATKSKSCITITTKNNTNKSPMKQQKPKSSTCIIENKISSYEYRFKAQKNIIEMQKEKLLEQNRLIEELKLNNIQKQASESLINAQNELKKRLPNNKYKPKIINDEQELKENKIENPSLNLMEAPKIVKKMAERAKEREEKRLLIKERKKLLEEQKKQEAEEAIKKKVKEELLERQGRVEKMRKQREQVRQLELRKQYEKKRYIEMNELAIAHYKKKLKQTAINYLKMLIVNVRIKIEIGRRFYENNIVIKCFENWKNNTKEIINQRSKLVVNFYNKTLLKNAMDTLKQFKLNAIRNKQVAIDRYEMSLQIKYFTAWHLLVSEYHIQYKINCKKADKYYFRMLLFQCFHSWRSLPAILQIERVQNERKRKWRLRVAEILTDYDPLKDYEQ